MDNSKQIKDYLQTNGKTNSWKEIADMFGVQGTSKQKSDYVRRLSAKIGAKSLNEYYFQEVKPKEPWVPSYITTSTAFLNPPKKVNWVDEASGLVWDDNLGDYNEFVAWKKSQEKNLNGIHIVIGCMHVPFHNKPLLNKLLQFIQQNQSKIVGFHLLGDYLDMRSVSKHNENSIDLSGFTLGKEYAAGNLILNMFDEVLPKGIQKTFIYGNHEDRYFRHINDIRNYKTADAIQSPKEALNLEARGYEVKENWKEDYFQVGKYQLIHGIYCTTNSAKTHIDRLRSSVVFAHTHRIGQHFESVLHGVNIGTMADMNSDAFYYLSRVERRTWKNGFGIINVNGNESHAEVVVCENNSFFFGGVKY